MKHSVKAWYPQGLSFLNLSQILFFFAWQKKICNSKKKYLYAEPSLQISVKQQKMLLDKKFKNEFKMQINYLKCRHMPITKNSNIFIQDRDVKTVSKLLSCSIVNFARVQQRYFRYKISKKFFKIWIMYLFKHNLSKSLKISFLF